MQEIDSFLTGSGAAAEQAGDTATLDTLLAARTSPPSVRSGSSSRSRPGWPATAHAT